MWGIKRKRRSNSSPECGGQGGLAVPPLHEPFWSFSGPLTHVALNALTPSLDSYINITHSSRALCEQRTEVDSIQRIKLREGPHKFSLENNTNRNITERAQGQQFLKWIVEKCLDCNFLPTVRTVNLIIITILILPSTHQGHTRHITQMCHVTSYSTCGCTFSASLCRQERQDAERSCKLPWP